MGYSLTDIIKSILEWPNHLDKLLGGGGRLLSMQCKSIVAEAKKANLIPLQVHILYHSPSPENVLKNPILSASLFMPSKVPETCSIGCSQQVLLM